MERAGTGDAVPSADKGVARGIRDYLGTLFGYSGAGAGAAVCILILQGLTQGAGILMLIPMLRFAGLAGDGGDGGDGGGAALASTLFEKAGWTPDLFNVLLVYVLIVAFHALLNFAQGVLNTRIQQGYTRFLRNRLYEAVVRAGWLFLARIRPSDLTQILTTTIRKVGIGTHSFLNLLGSGVILAVHVLLSFVMAPVMAGVVTLCAGGMLLLLRPLNRKALELGTAMHETNRGIFEVVTEYLGGMKIAKSLGGEARHIESFQNAASTSEREQVRFATIRAASAGLSTVGAVVCIACLFYVAVELVELAPARLFVLLYLFSRILPRVSALHQNYQQIVNMLPAFSAVMEMMERCRAAAEFVPRNRGARLPLVEGIAFSGVSFGYGEGREGFVLEGLDVFIPARSTTAIVGPSGAGKTTFADLVMGLMPPTLGEIRVDGLLLTEERLQGWRKAVGYVPQDTFLFNDTIRANLLWARPDADEAQMRQALDVAAALDFVTALPEGLDTVVGDRGARLSGGERQRIALARALLRSPDLLLLDEAASALDVENERRIQEAVDRLKGERTILVIAHRLETVRAADYILVMEAGGLVESGTWESLSRLKNGRFRAMLRAGAGGFPDAGQAPREGGAPWAGKAPDRGRTRKNGPTDMKQ